VTRFVGVMIGSGLCLFAIVHVGARLTAGAQRYRDLFQRVPVGMYRSTPDGRFLDVNAQFAAMFGFAAPEELLAISAADLYADPQDRATFRDAVDDAGVARNVEFRARRHDGTVFWVRDSALLVRDSVGAPLYYEGILEDVTEHKHQEQRLEHRASIDSLTGLANRAVLIDALDEALRQASPERPAALLFVDLDDFKQVNDRFGHAAGDLALAGAARRLRDATRGADTTARFGGDEFAVVLQPPAGRDVAEAVARRVAAAFREPFSISGDEIVVGASIGIAIAEEPMPNSELIERADRAMYRAKNLDKIEIFGR
jgi:diguanylate cyclase (GGDEF)-like protein/PAS domain S-box-containing protein